MLGRWYLQPGGMVSGQCLMMLWLSDRFASTLPSRAWLFTELERQMPISFS